MQLEIWQGFITPEAVVLFPSKIILCFHWTLPSLSYLACKIPKFWHAIALKLDDWHLMIPWYTQTHVPDWQFPGVAETTDSLDTY